MMVRSETRVMRSPATVMNFNGAVENDVMPSMENDIILRSGYFDSPAVRAVRS